MFCLPAPYDAFFYTMTPLLQPENPDLRLHRMTIDGHGDAAGFAATAAGQRSLDCDPMDILVVCARQGGLSVQASFIPHPIDLRPGEAMFLANPRAPWSIQWIHDDQAAWHTLTISAARFHEILKPGFDPSRLANMGAFNLRDLMKRIPVTPALFIGFDQLLYQKTQTAFGGLFQQAKFLEIISLLLDAAFGQPVETCPVAMSPAIEEKIRDIRRHIMDHIDAEPDADQLAIDFDLPRTTLREGFRYLFGKTVHQFHADYKLEWAMQRLTTGESLVKEVAFAIGYQNPSHFIAAFKKKFGFTPKQYLKREVVST
jgi:AraC-like DNA-binding protein